MTRPYVTDRERRGAVENVRLIGAAVAAVLTIAAILWGPRIWLRSNIEWVNVQAGEFTMGSNEGDSDEQPVHPVSLDAFRISKYEITNAQYARCVRGGGCAPPSDRTYYNDPQYANHPVVYVSWHDAQAFCEWVWGGLPTEAQWEKAARGTDGREYPWGNQEPTPDLCNFSWYAGGTTPVGTHSPQGDSPYGCADMAGNVWEWVADWYDEGYYAYSPSQNPPGLPEGDHRVLRGGSWGYDPLFVRAADRVRYLPTGRLSSFGFRCARGSR